MKQINEMETNSTLTVSGMAEEGERMATSWQTHAFRVSTAMMVVTVAAFALIRSDLVSWNEAAQPSARRAVKDLWREVKDQQYYDMPSGLEKPSEPVSKRVRILEETEEMGDGTHVMELGHGGVEFGDDKPWHHDVGGGVPVLNADELVRDTAPSCLALAHELAIVADETGKERRRWC